MPRLHVALFRLTYALAGAAFLVALLGLLWQARFSDAVRLALPFAGGFYVTANLMYARYRVATMRLRRRSLYASERALQAFLLLSLGTALLFACSVFFHGHTAALAGSAWLLAICALPLFFIVSAYASLYFSLNALARRYFRMASLRDFARDLR